MSATGKEVVRYRSIDFLKGIACIAVVLIHVQFPGTVGFAVRQVCRFAVPFFFLVSGFFFLKTDKQLEATARKLRHAIFLFLGAMAFHLVICLLGIGGIPFRSYIREFLQMPQLLNFFVSNPPYRWSHLWFLGALVYIYLFALVWFGNGKRLWSALPCGAVLLIGTMAFQEFAEYLPFSPRIPVVGARFCVLFVFRALPFFLLGVWLRTKEDAIRAIRLPTLWLVIIVISGAFLAVVEAKLTVNSQFYVGNYLMVAGLFLWAMRNPINGYQPLEFVGKNLSLYVYVIHIVVGQWLTDIFRHGGLESYPAVLWLTPLLVVLFSSGLAFIFNVIMKIICARGGNSSHHDLLPEV